jgi:hypothetical protein
MTPIARRPAVPRVVVATWVLAMFVGSAAVAIAATRPEPQPRTLSPRTAARYLAEIVPVSRDDVRVNGIVGSGHTGAWQFVAHVTWLESDGVIDGGVTVLPDLAGGDPWDSPVDQSEFPHEHEIGWTLDQLATVLGHADGSDDELAMVELEITESRDSVIVCHGQRDAVARCTEFDRTGRRIRAFTSRLSDTPLAGAVAVERA